MSELEALLILNAIPGIGSRRLKSLLDYFKDARKILSVSQDELRRVEGVTEKLAYNILDFKDKIDLKKELDLIKKYKVDLLTINHKDYPENLKTIYDPPAVLYVKGEFMPRDTVSIAIVGSRRASFYGLSMAEKLAWGLAGFNFTIVSGLARGIDTASHKGALKANGRTVAVLGSGLANIYPPENKDLFNQICDNGAVISEFPMQMEPLAQNFPRRNRIISGLSLGVAVVEAARNSGALITADYALEQNREVFAIPGEVSSLTSYGTHRLIKQGAKLVDSVDDIIEELKPKIEHLIKDVKKGKSQTIETVLKPKLTPEEELLYNRLSAQPKHIEEIGAELDMPVQRLLALLLRLEMRHVARQLPGKLFVRANV
jgi:DNA processing protein